MVWRCFLVILIFAIVMIVLAHTEPAREEDDPPNGSVYPQTQPSPGLPLPTLPSPGQQPIKGDRLTRQAFGPARDWQPTALAPQAGELPRVPLPPRRPGTTPSSAEVAAICVRRGLKIWVRIEGKRYDCAGG